MRGFLVAAPDDPLVVDMLFGGVGKTILSAEESRKGFLEAGLAGAALFRGDGRPTGIGDVALLRNGLFDGKSSVSDVDRASIVGKPSCQPLDSCEE